MFVTNKRVKIPSHIKIDYAFLFVYKCQNTVFKSFILPYFDYCATIFIYFPKIILQKIINLFYFCLFKLFGSKFSFEPKEHVKNNEPVTELESSIEFELETNLELEKFNMNSFLHRLFVRFSTFTWRIVNLSTAPIELKSQITTRITSSISHDTTTSSSSDVIKLRSDRVISKNGVSKLKFGELTFAKFFNKLINNCIKPASLNSDFTTFCSYIAVNNAELFNKFIKQFHRFDLTIKNFNYKKN